MSVMPPTIELPQYATVREVATAYRRSPDTIREWIRSGRLRAHRAGPKGHWLVSMEDARALLDPSQR